MKKRNQASIIAEAISADIPEDKSQWPEYYRQRMDICAVCDKNTSNGGLGAVGKFASKKIGAQCSACLCLIKYKCWSKNEECGLAHIEGATPKWNRILMETTSSDFFDVENLSFEKYNLGLTEDGYEFVFNLGDIKSEDETIFEFRVIPKKQNLEFHEPRMCGCMASKNKLYDGSVEMKIKLVTPVAVGSYNKLIVVEFLDKDNFEEDGANKKVSCLVRVLANVLPSEASS